MKPETFWDSRLTAREVMGVLNQVLAQSYALSDVHGLFLERLECYLEDREDSDWELDHWDDTDDSDDDWDDYDEDDDCPDDCEENCLTCEYFRGGD